MNADKRGLKQKIALFIENYSVDFSPSILNMVEFLAGQFQLDIYIRHVYWKKSSILSHENVTLLEVRENLKTEILRRVKNIAKFFLRWDFTWKDLRQRTYSTRYIRKSRPLEDYYAFLCFDSQGLLLCNELFPSAKPIHYSLEFFLEQDFPNLHHLYTGEEIHFFRTLKDLETPLLKNISGLFIQSQERADYFRDDYGVPGTVPSLLLPVTWKGQSIREKSSYLRDKYNIPKTKKIALHFGGIYPYYGCLEIAESFAGLEDWVLVFHGLAEKNYLAEIERVIEEKSIKNIIFSREYFAQIEDTAKILMSADLGLAWYKNLTVNLGTAGKSSGKIPGYLRFGLPVIVNHLPGTVEAVVETGCGVSVGAFSQIPHAVKEVEKDIRRLSENCYNEFDKTYRFDRYKEDILSFIAQCVEA